MRTTRHVTCVLVFLSTSAIAACTSLLGSYEVGGSATGPDGTEGGPGSEGGPGKPEGGSDVFVPPDSAIDSPPACTAPMTACGTACVDLDSDKDNCGMCNRDCLGGPCNARVCGSFSLVARADVADRTLAATDTELFFGTTTGQSQLIQQPAQIGTMPITLATLPGTQVGAIAPAPPSMRVYFTSVMAGGPWQVWDAKIGSASSGMARNPTVGGEPRGLVAAGGNVHLLRITSTTGATAFEIMACPVNGASCFGNYNGTGIPGTKLAAGDGYVFWTDQFSGTVYAYADMVGLQKTVASGEPGADYPVWDGTTLFWDNTGSTRIRKSVYPNAAPTDVRDINASTNDMLVDTVNVYWSIYNGLDNDLFATPKSVPGAMPTRLAHGEIRRLAQTAKGIYWANAQGISGVRKP